MDSEGFVGDTVGEAGTHYEWVLGSQLGWN